MEEILKKILVSSGISGYEKEIAEILSNELRKCCDDVHIDKFGNVIAKKGKGEKKIMLAAHMDEIGLLVKHISKEGFVKFIKIGGIDDRALLGQRVIIKGKNRDVLGVIGIRPPHLQKEDEKKLPDKYEDMFIDIGFDTKEEVLQIVSVGDQIIFEPNAGILNGNLYYGKAVDNRVGCYALIKIMEKINVNAEIYAVSTVQEEVGLKGAQISSFKLNPDFALIIDTTTAGDTPQIKESESSLKLGVGVAVTIIEASGRGVMVGERVKNMIVNTAKEHDIKYQIDISEYGVTDGSAISINREGIMTGILSIPIRYSHSATGVFSIEDVNSAVELAIHVIERVINNDIQG
jgi:endoglucanase